MQHKKLLLNAHLYKVVSPSLTLLLQQLAFKSTHSKVLPTKISTFPGNLLIPTSHQNETHFSVT